MWTLEARSGPVRVVAVAAYLAAVVLLVLFQELGLRLRKEQRRAWWAGNGRDLLNALGFSAVATALRAFGFAWPVAVASGATLTLAIFGSSVLLETRVRTRHPRAWALLAALALALPALLWPGETVAAFGWLLGALFPL